MEQKSLFDDIIGIDDPMPKEDEINNNTSNVEEQEEDNDDEFEDRDKKDSQSDSNTDIEDADERVLAVYDLMLESRIVDEIEGFKGTPQELKELVDSLPERYLDLAISSLSPDSQDLLVYASNLGEKATKEELKKFFDLYVDTPTYNLEDEEQAYNYLKEKLQGNKTFKNEEKLAAHLDSLAEDGSLVEIAKELYEEDQTKIKEEKENRKKEVEAERTRQQQEIATFYKSLEEHVNSYNWKDERKKTVLKNLDPQEAGRKNNLIAKSPKALVQLADIYSRFNEQTGEFDLSDFEIKAKSKENIKVKEDLQKKSINSALNKIKLNKSSNRETGFFESLTPVN